MQPRKIVIFYTDAGGGHRATAIALQDILRETTSHEIRLCNPYRELIGDIDLFPKLTPYTNEEVYNTFVLRQGWNNFFCLLYYGLTILNVKLGTRRSVKRFLDFWQEEKVDLVISVMPLANAGIYRSIRAYSRKSPVPLIVLITDLEEKQKNVWFPRPPDYHIICGSARSHEQALSKVHDPSLIHRTSGLPVNPAFYRKEVENRMTERKNLGLEPDWPTGCMMYGSAGSKKMAQLAESLKEVGQNFQMIFLCGHNQPLMDDLQEMDLPYPHLIYPYTKRIPYYFQLCDFLICKPGPGTLSEAMVSGLSLLVDTYNVLPQEQYNVRWIQEKGVGFSFRNSSEFSQAVEQLLHSGLAAASHAVSSEASSNRSVFEISTIIRDILE